MGLKKICLLILNLALTNMLDLGQVILACFRVIAKMMEFASNLFFFFKCFLISLRTSIRCLLALFIYWLCDTWNLSSLPRNQTHAPCIASAES